MQKEAARKGRWKRRQVVILGGGLGDVSAGKGLQGGEDDAGRVHGGELGNAK